MRSLMLYHMKPAGLVGEIIYPLADLETALPKVYEKEVQKYTGRGSVPKNFIPPLCCYWHEVVFLSAVHPRTLAAALRACGDREERHFQAFQIDPNTLDQSKLAVYEFASPGQDVRGWYRPFDIAELAEYDRIVEATMRADIDRAFREKRSPFLFEGVTHVFYKGQLSVAGLPVVTG